jgi:hypothetical protein
MAAHPRWSVGLAGLNQRERASPKAEVISTRGSATVKRRSLVGDDGATAAWTIAQHSDLEPQFQEQALELMRQAAAAGEADPR